MALPPPAHGSRCDLGVKDIAAHFHVSERTARRWVKRGLVPVIRIGGIYRTTREALDQFTARELRENARHGRAEHPRGTDR